MSKMVATICLLCCLTLATPSLAGYADLQASTSGVSGPTVTVSVNNPTTNSVTARVRVVVKLDDDTYYILTSAAFTVTSGATTSVSITAPQSVAEIEDNPEPISAVQ